ncbi:hypothetical protein [uncultured Roseobacter sp.]|uniref:hypothetical protein n=1 Tax=uncultured Roseobacter sp. TaxID=114847 RepID=UPI0026174985|nr:hypothetical protein [uncultured Roseobacter sp.]
MDHLKPFAPRTVLPLSLAQDHGWSLKRYAIVADGRAFAEGVVSAATEEAMRRLPAAGPLENSAGNHSIGFQIIHFAEVAVVSPVFYWQWGSVLAQMGQMRAGYDDPTTFKDGVQEVVGCIWELNIVKYETWAWQTIMLGAEGGNQETLTAYLGELAGSPRT